MTPGIEVAAHIRGTGDGHGRDDVSDDNADSDPDVGVDAGELLLPLALVVLLLSLLLTMCLLLPATVVWKRLNPRSRARSGTGELEKRLDVAIICSFDHFQIFRACLTLFDQIVGTPSKYGAAKLHCEYICD